MTSYVDDNALAKDYVEVPGYYVAEWIAENWWPLLWEPRKNEDFGDDPDFRQRHSLLAAQHGFALPNVTIISTGANVSVYAGARRSDYAEVQFHRSGESLLSREQVEAQLHTFVDDAISQLGELRGSPLSEAWEAIRSTTDEDERFFCSLIGALGLSPYEQHPAIEHALDSASSILSRKQLFDLCATSLPEEVVKSAFVACHAERALDGSTSIDISGLGKIAAPVDITGAPAYQTGYRAARKLRTELAIGERDVEGAHKIFDKLAINGSVGYAAIPPSDLSIFGATKRSQHEGKISLVQGSQASKRFATARATYLLWTSDAVDARLITGAATRDQQASRAFAAELLMPRAFVKSLADGNRIAWTKIQEVGEQQLVAPEAIRLQAQNAGLQVVR